MKEIITLIIAVYGAVLATVTFITQRLEKTPRVRVSAALGFQVSGVGPSETQVLLTAANVGHMPITISNFGFKLSDRSSIIMPFSQQLVPLPHELLIGKSCTFYFSLKSLAVGLIEKGHRGNVKLRPFVAAQSGRTYEGKAIDADTNAWLRGS